MTGTARVSQPYLCETGQGRASIYRGESDETCLLFCSGAMIVQETKSTREAVERTTKLFDQLSSCGPLDLRSDTPTSVASDAAFVA